MESSCSNSISLYSLLTVAFLIITFFSTTTLTEANNNIHLRPDGAHRRLFVFGDSYADTGNLGKLGRDLTHSWYPPYGASFPGYPTGRFSDGRLLTDYIASFIGNRSPIPYKYRKLGAKLRRRNGMNFAVGGSGVFDTGNLQRNLSAQIDSFQAQISEGFFSIADIKNSVALVAISGYDYVHYLESGRDIGGLFDFVKNVTMQLEIDLKRIHGIGVSKVVLTNLHPVGCTPYVTRGKDYTQCDSFKNNLAQFHNDHVSDIVKELAKYGGCSKFLVLDLYKAFLLVINQEKGATRISISLRPCCDGIDEESVCGEVDEHGNKLYIECRDPRDHFYWDSVHPTQAGWAAVIQAIHPWLKENLSI